jgi:hypothetical protein
MNSLEWKRAKRNASGSREWASKCGRYVVAASEMCFGVPLNPVYYTVWVRYTVHDINRRFESYKRLGVMRESKRTRAGYRQEKWYTRAGALRAAAQHSNQHKGTTV